MINSLFLIDHDRYEFLTERYEVVGSERPNRCTTHTASPRRGDVVPSMGGLDPEKIFKMAYWPLFLVRVSCALAF
jgi:hypothetical protein